MEKIIKPWGWELLLEKNNNYVVKKLFMKNGERCSLQYHKQKHETIYVLSGVLKIQHGMIKEEIISVDLKAGDVFVCLPNCIHRMIGVEDCLYLESSTPELDDVIRIEDDYGRANEI